MIISFLCLSDCLKKLDAFERFIRSFYLLCIKKSKKHIQLLMHSIEVTKNTEIVFSFFES